MWAAKTVQAVGYVSLCDINQLTGGVLFFWDEYSLGEYYTVEFGARIAYN